MFTSVLRRNAPWPPNLTDVDASDPDATRAALDGFAPDVAATHRGADDATSYPGRSHARWRVSSPSPRHCCPCRLMSTNELVQR